MLNFVLCDDNINILNKLSKMLDSIFINNNFDAQVAFKSISADKILDYIKFNKVDVLFFDINLHSHMSGLELAEVIRQYDKNVYIVFTTGHLEYAMMAYRYKTFDYLAKPITYERLQETVVRLYADIYDSSSHYLKIDNKLLVNENEILFIERDGMKLVYHTVSKDYEAYNSFNKIEDSLPSNFVRCHKSYIVNVNKILHVHGNKIYFENDFVCFIGPKYKNNLLEVLENYGNI